MRCVSLMNMNIRNINNPIWGSQYKIMYAHGIHDLAWVRRWCQWSFPNGTLGNQFRASNRKKVTVSISPSLYVRVSFIVLIFILWKEETILILTAFVCWLDGWIDGDEWPNYGWFNVTKCVCTMSYSTVETKATALLLYWHSFFLSI